MKKDKQVTQTTVEDVSVPPPVTETSLPQSQPERLEETDRLALELAKSRRETALAEAKTAIANNEKADLSYRYVVLQLYMKHGLSSADAISESGEIIRGGAIPQGQTK